MVDSGNIELTVKNILQELNIEYEWIKVDPDFADTLQFCEKYGFKMEESGTVSYTHLTLPTKRIV